MTSKLLIISSLCLLCIASCKKEEEKPVGPDPVPADYTDYRILYQMTDLEDSVSMELAYDVQSAIKESYDVDVKVFAANKVSPSEKEIIIGRTDVAYAQEFYDSKPDDFSYRMKWEDKRIFISAGGSWALEAAVDRFITEVIEQKLAYEEGREISGSVRGEFLFPRTEGTNLRILDDNIWAYNSSTNAAAWQAIGENCTNAVRSKGFAALLKAYAPDIVAFQECASKMKTCLADTFSDLGLVEAGIASDDQTPIFYNTRTLELKAVEYKLYGDFTPEGGSKITPGQSKSYTLAVFEHKTNRSQFIMVSTHLWWKSESTQAGSDLCREAEARTLMSAISDMLKVYDVPVFVTGDMNSKLATPAMKQFTNAGYQPLVNVATEFADGSNGWHECSATGFARETLHCVNEKGERCIDQFFLYNDKKMVEVKWFERIHAYFTIKLTDHYPNFADIKLK